MTMNKNVRKFVLTLHIVCSVGWLGAVVAYLALAVATLANKDAQMVQATYQGMALILRFVIVPLALTSLVAGLTMALGTRWGLLKHYWVLAKILIIIPAIMILLEKSNILKLPVILRELAGIVFFIIVMLWQTIIFLASVVVPSADLSAGWSLLHPGGALLALLVTVTLAVYKPKGLTSYGQRKK